MLAEYSDTANEAQVWNGGATEWKAQKADTEELPGASTGWDVNVNGNKIAEEHQGYYHTYATEGRSVLFDDHAAADKRSVTIVGTVAADSIEVAASGYEFKAGDAAELKADAKLTVRSMASLHSEVALNLSDLTLEAGAELSSDNNITVSGDFQVNGMPEATTFNLRSRVTPEASVNADLDLIRASSIVLESTVNMNGHRLLLNSETPITLDYNVADSNMTFFTNVKELLVTTAEGEAVTLTPGTDVTQYISLYNNGEQLPEVSIIYTISGDIGMAAVPEPGTATLSLLALAALVSRRRRR